MKSKELDPKIVQDFAIAASVLMTMVFPRDPRPNPRRLMFGVGPAGGAGDLAHESIRLDLDMVCLAFRSGLERRGPCDITVHEMREGELRTWTGCRFWQEGDNAPLHLLTSDPGVTFGYDGNALVILWGGPEDPSEGVLRARRTLRSAARRVPGGIPTRRLA